MSATNFEVLLNFSRHGRKMNLEIGESFEREVSKVKEVIVHKSGHLLGYV